MNQKLIFEIGKSQRLQIINRLKRTQGLAVSELAEALKMSYMGVKQHCLDLHQAGYLDTWRRPKPVGRPEMIYRLTDRAQQLFPQTSHALTLALLDAAGKLYGASAAEKLLFTVFHQQAADYAAKLKGDSPAARAQSLARLRDQHGFMADFVHDGVPQIIEHHSPILDLLRAYPIVARLEQEMFQRVLQTSVTREESHASGLYRCVFNIGLS